RGDAGGLGFAFPPQHVLLLLSSMRLPPLSPHGGKVARGWARPGRAGPATNELRPAPGGY
ncbi:hypothetical protein ABTK80_21140, partial [Acinetobacter baumannii]